ncbi:MAG: serpin family protein [Candidatus Nanoarchaeia archaeon]
MQKKFRVNIIVIFLIFIATIMSGCTLYNSSQTPLADDSNSSQEGVEEVVRANNAFPFNLYYELDKEEDGNLFFSPYSIFAALAITYEGANGQTAEEMREVFDFPDTEILRSNFAAIYNTINQNQENYELKTSNALWAQQDYEFLDDYTTTISRYYGGETTNLDFRDQAEESRKTINSYVESETEGKIKNLFPENSLNSALLVITNAIYFKGDWREKFDESNTREEEFKVNSNTTVMADMMHLDPAENSRFNYADLEQLQILELPYKGEEVSMLILLPKQGEFYNYESQERETLNYTLEDIELSQEKLNEYKSAMEETEFSSISIPKFEFNTKYQMKELLTNLGMPLAFTEGADFSSMDGTTTLYIDKVIHQAFVSVNEEGTEAAAATGVVMVQDLVAMSNTFRADHPFIFVIQHKETDSILFMGRVVDPTQQ